MSHFTVTALHRDPEVNLDKLLEPFCECTENPDYLEFEEDEYGDFDEEHGANGYYRNPNAKWDWYQVGGRWNNMLKRKSDGVMCNSAQIKDIDFTPSQEIYVHALMVWDYLVEDKPWKGEPGKEPFKIFKPEYYRELYGDRETYAMQQATLSTYAYLTEAGEWVEPGKMGWFGMSSETKDSKREYNNAFDRDVIHADPELYLTIIDCHI